MVGVRFHEVLRGTYHLLSDPGDELPMSLSIVTQVGLRALLLLKREAEISGEIDMQGFADHRPFRGALVLDLLAGQRLVYDLRFADNAGRECRFRGERELVPRRLLESLTTLPGTVWCEDREQARAVLRFDTRQDLLRMVGSVRPA
ncbi:MAG: hypothetical protein K8H88_23940 [Sandaracinaceae bacterium]|nr:hypothetical protein [Sandaracinaceae bacterium]